MMTIPSDAGTANGKAKFGARRGERFIYRQKTLQKDFFGEQLTLQGRLIELGQAAARRRAAPQTNKILSRVQFAPTGCLNGVHRFTKTALGVL